MSKNLAEQEFLKSKEEYELYELTKKQKKDIYIIKYNEKMKEVFDYCYEIYNAYKLDPVICKYDIYYIDDIFDFSNENIDVFLFYNKKNLLYLLNKYYLLEKKNITIQETSFGSSQKKNIQIKTYNFNVLYKNIKLNCIFYEEYNNMEIDDYCIYITLQHKQNIFTFQKYAYTIDPYVLITYYVFLFCNFYDNELLI